jgi:hypothetical protein
MPRRRNAPWKRSLRADLFRQVWDLVDKPTFPQNIRDMAIAPVLNQLIREVQDVCVAECSRISTDQIELTDAERDSYWDRLRMPAADQDEEEPRKHLLIETFSAPCKAGFALDDDHLCPIVSIRDPERNIEAVLTTIEQIIRERGGIRP